MGNRTPLYDQHVAAKAKIVDFGGWDMPIHYGSQIEEHHAVRKGVGMCDVSHMTVVDVSGPAARDYLRHLLANDVAKLDVGGALYSTMLNDDGDILDDLIVYRRDEDYRVVVNCATREKDLDWMTSRAEGFDVTIRERDDLAIIAVQGPDSLERVSDVMGGAVAGAIAGLKPFSFATVEDMFVARTGYTGEKGVEIILPGGDAPALWASFEGAGVVPVGLGARDTLRLEAGMNLYGSDMDEQVTPAESNLSWTVATSDDRDFIGRKAIEAAQPRARLVSLIMQARGVIRAHYRVFAGDDDVGEVTSGAFSPTLQHSIAFARIDAGATAPLTVEIRGKRVPVEIVKSPFVRNGKRVYKETEN